MLILACGPWGGGQGRELPVYGSDSGPGWTLSDPRQHVFLSV